MQTLNFTLPIYETLCRITRPDCKVRFTRLDIKNQVTRPNVKGRFTRQDNVESSVQKANGALPV